MDDTEAMEIEKLFRRRCKELRIPVATLGIDDGHEIRQFALGVLNLDTGVETTPSIVT